MQNVETTISPEISGALPRIDGPVKVTGTAAYTSDHSLPGMLYAVPVCASIAKGRIESLDTSRAESMLGVKAVYHRRNIGKLFRSGPGDQFLSERRPPFQDDVIRYYGQYIAVAVALTFEQATAAAGAVKVAYSVDKPDVRDRLEAHEITEEAPEVDSHRGDPEQAFTSADVKVDGVYSTPVETHNPIELHATVASWDGERYLIYETTQGVVNHRDIVAQMLGVPSENVRVISRFLGSGFGGKLSPWPHSVIAAAAARNLNRPVKLVLTRRMMFQNVGHRPRTQQRVRLGATSEGKLVSFIHDTLNHTSILDDYNEGCTEVTPYSYSTPNLRATSAIVRRNVGPSTIMRGPGAVPGLFATESAMDELAVRLNIDPVKLRLMNEPKKDEGLNLPFSSRHFVECILTGAEKFGWSSRDPRVASMKKNGLSLGWGVAGCSWAAERSDAQAAVDLRDDGTVRVATSVHDIGTGMYTVLAEIVAQRLGIPHAKIEVVIGDTALPSGPSSGASRATASIIPAVLAAVEDVFQALFKAAIMVDGTPFYGRQADTLAFTEGCLQIKEDASGVKVPFQEILKRSDIRLVTGLGKSERTLDNPARKFSTHSFGAQFVEVTWEWETASLRVSRVVSVIDGGRIINPKPARNQIEGAVVMGIGMALFEETSYDERFGSPINNSFADYIVATNADSPEIDVTFLNYPDLVLNELGARGIGEIGMAGIAPAITSAVYHATGVRVRNLPVRIEDLLASPPLVRI
ncbi:MAG TPA: xanthine dehydrogenase family protein molybdopterin-binding subunit [Acidobacteriaceae bacterium]